MPKPNNNLLIRSILLLFILCSYQISFSQGKLDSVFNKLDPQRYVNAIDKKLNGLEDKITQKSLQTLNKLQLKNI